MTIISSTLIESSYHVSRKRSFTKYVTLNMYVGVYENVTYVKYITRCYMRMYVGIFSRHLCYVFCERPLRSKIPPIISKFPPSVQNTSYRDFLGISAFCKHPPCKKTQHRRELKKYYFDGWRGVKFHIFVNSPCTSYSSLLKFLYFSGNMKRYLQKQALNLRGCCYLAYS